MTWEVGNMIIIIDWNPRLCWLIELIRHGNYCCSQMPLRKAQEDACSISWLGRQRITLSWYFCNSIEVLLCPRSGKMVLSFKSAGVCFFLPCALYKVKIKLNITCLLLCQTSATQVVWSYPFQQIFSTTLLDCWPRPVKFDIGLFWQQLLQQRMLVLNLTLTLHISLPFTEPNIQW